MSRSKTPHYSIGGRGISHKIACEKLREFVESQFSAKGKVRGCIRRASANYGVHYNTLRGYMTGHAHMPKWIAEKAGIDIVWH